MWAMLTPREPPPPTIAAVVGRAVVTAAVPAAVAATTAATVPVSRAGAFTCPETGGPRGGPTVGR